MEIRKSKGSKERDCITEMKVNKLNSRSDMKQYCSTGTNVCVAACLGAFFGIAGIFGW